MYHFIHDSDDVRAQVEDLLDQLREYDSSSAGGDMESADRRRQEPHAGAGVDEAAPFDHFDPTEVEGGDFGYAEGHDDMEDIALGDGGEEEDIVADLGDFHGDELHGDLGAVFFSRLPFGATRDSYQHRTPTIPEPPELFRHSSENRIAVLESIQDTTPEETYLGQMGDSAPEIVAPHHDRDIDNDSTVTEDDFFVLNRRRRRRRILYISCLVISLIGIVAVVVATRVTDSSTEASTLIFDEEPESSQPTLAPTTRSTESQNVNRILCTSADVISVASVEVVINGTTAGISEDEVQMLRSAMAESYTYAALLACDEPYYRNWDTGLPGFVIISDTVFRLQIALEARQGGPQPFRPFDYNKDQTISTALLYERGSNGNQIANRRLPMDGVPLRRAQQTNCGVLDIMRAPSGEECASGSETFDSGICECPRDGCYCLEDSLPGAPSSLDFLFMMNQYIDYIRDFGNSPARRLAQTKVHRATQSVALQSLGYVVGVREPVTTPNSPTVSPAPSSQPSFFADLVEEPSAAPSQSSVSPSVSGSPSLAPSGVPSTSSKPTSRPSGSPSVAPTALPSQLPTSDPSSNPSTSPSGSPSELPSSQPSEVPSGIPSRLPSLEPSSSPSSLPSLYPTTFPSSEPSGTPSSLPSSSPSKLPSTEPSRSPSLQPSQQPSVEPSMTPTLMPSAFPSSNPTLLPSIEPSNSPSAQPTQLPSLEPSTSPTSYPSAIPSTDPTLQPSMEPSSFPSSEPTQLPSLEPSTTPTSMPSSFPSNLPSLQPSTEPSSSPSLQPTEMPSLEPSTTPTATPSALPSSDPTLQPSTEPSSSPSSQPTEMPSLEPSTAPTSTPSSFPSSVPTLLPSVEPSRSPSSQPSQFPSLEPSATPTSIPSSFPSREPSSTPTQQPSSRPSQLPSLEPSTSPTLSPSSYPSMEPTAFPSQSPSRSPSSAPSSEPSNFACEVIVRADCETENGVRCDDIPTPNATCAFGVPLSEVQFTYIPGNTCSQTRNQQYGVAICEDISAGGSTPVTLECDGSDGEEMTVLPTDIGSEKSLFTVQPATAGNPLPPFINCTISSNTTSPPQPLQWNLIDTSGALELDLKEAFGSLQLEGCKVEGMENKACIEQLFLDSVLRNVGGDELNVTLVKSLKSIVNGRTPTDLLDQVHPNPLQPSESATVLEAAHFDFCETGEFSYVIMVEADPPDGESCEDQDNYQRTVDPGCSIDLNLTCSDMSAPVDDPRNCFEIPPIEIPECECQECARELIFRFTQAPCPSGPSGYDCDEQGDLAQSGTLAVSSSSASGIFFTTDISVGVDVVIVDTRELDFCVPQDLNITIETATGGQVISNLQTGCGTGNGIDLMTAYGSLLFTGYTCGQNGEDATNCFTDVILETCAENDGTTDLLTNFFELDVVGEGTDLLNGSSALGLEPGEVFCAEEALEISRCSGISYTVSSIMKTDSTSPSVCQDEVGLKFSIPPPFTLTPSSAPSSAPSNAPSALPSMVPSQSPSQMPTLAPSMSPSAFPSQIPTVFPSAEPSGSPSSLPTSTPTQQPSLEPSTSPSMAPSSFPTQIPSALPSSEPTSVPSSLPTLIPTQQPSFEPSQGPSTPPSSLPTQIPSAFPSSEPTSVPSSLPTLTPTQQPSTEPSESPSTPPSSFPTQIPSAFPSSEPTIMPSSLPTSIPTQQPSFEPSFTPSGTPSASPSTLPTSIPSLEPSKTPSSTPSLAPTASPSSLPSKLPTTIPSSEPSGEPSSFPSATPTQQPSTLPSLTPSASPSVLPSHLPTSFPSNSPSLEPSRLPSTAPSATPTQHPTALPSLTPSGVPSREPSSSPSSLPSLFPSVSPSSEPSTFPTMAPSTNPTASPTASPSASPTRHPTNSPTTRPTGSPSSIPSGSPSAAPSFFAQGASSPPSETPSATPTESPSLLPSSLPSEFDGLSTCTDEQFRTFTVYGRERNCTWLSQRGIDLRTIACDENLDAFDACHRTCGAVNIKHPCNPRYVPPENGVSSTSIDGNFTSLEEIAIDENNDDENNSTTSTTPHHQRSLERKHTRIKEPDG